MQDRLPKRSLKGRQENRPDRLSASLRFDAPVSIVSQVSAKRTRVLESRGIVRVRDLLDLYPRRYLDMTQVVSIAQAQIGSSCTIVGTIHEVKAKTTRRRLTLVEITFVDGTGTLIVTCFNQPWLAQKLTQGDSISIAGTVEFNYGFKRMTNPLISPLADAGEARGIVQAFHSSISSISPAQTKRMIANALKLVTGLYDPLPLSLRKKYRLCSRYQAYRAIHFPRDLEEVAMARRRLLYEELLFLELQLVQEEKQHAEKNTPFQQTANAGLIDRTVQLIPFDLTNEQSAAISEILEDMGAPRVMDRLLLGDVGTGKTIVALFALVVAACNAHQAVMVGPTEILVRQYGRALGPILDKLGISWDVLTGTTSPADQQQISEALETGELSICFATHAIFGPAVRFKDCSLICIDEQQRFGVEQRESLLEKAPGADVLSMTATPIPRSLALALYGTTSLSYLRQVPKMRQARTSTVLPFTDEGIAYDAVRAALARGEQAYVVCPLIGISTEDLSRGQEEDEQVEYALIEFGLESDSAFGESSEKATYSRFVAAETHAKILRSQVFPNARVELLHGRMSSEDKACIMEAFVKGEVDILVSTTIVEVGIDVPNATVMIIEDADRFGLAQLHQLRGRVGRGDKPGEVFLVTRSKAPQALERLRALEVTEDGFELSEIDLAQRKEGDVFGARQHGRSPLRLVNVIRDSAVIEAAFKDAHAIVYDGILSSDEQAILVQELAMVTQRASS